MATRTALVLAAVLVAAGCGATRATTSTRTVSPTAPLITVTAPPQAAPPRAEPPLPRPDPGLQPQTAVRPSAATADFQSEMAALWRAVETGNVTAGRAAFFPESAYVQVKGIVDPRGDYRARLLSRYAADIAAAHALVAARPGAARVLRVAVPETEVHWVPPEVCANRDGYWEVPNARIIYAQGGVERSFGIASMISWRGVWYVVHLGAVVPTGAGGTVDDPEIGPGVSAPSSTC